MIVVIGETEYVQASVAAEHLATTGTRILMLLKKKELSGELIEGSWFVTRASLNSYEGNASEPGQEPSCRTGCSSSGCGCKYWLKGRG